MKAIILVYFLLLIIVGCDNKKTQILKNLDKGIEYFYLKDYKKSIYHLNTSLLYDSNNVKCNLYLAKCFLKIKNADEAFVSLKRIKGLVLDNNTINEKAVKAIDGVSIDSLYDVYVKWLAVKKESTMIILLGNKWAKVSPENYMPYLKISQGYLMEFHKHRETFGASYDYKTRGFAQGELNGAYENVMIAFKLNPNSPEVLLNKGIIRVAMNDAEGAMKDYNLALGCSNIDSNIISRTYASIGEIYIDKDDFKSAIDYFNLSITFENRASTFINRGLSYIELSNRRKACEDFSEGINLGNEDAMRFYNKYCNN